MRKDHLLRTLRQLVNGALFALKSEFSSMYSGLRRPSIALKKPRRVILLQAFYSIRSEPRLKGTAGIFDPVFR